MFFSSRLVCALRIIPVTVFQSPRRARTHQRAARAQISTISIPHSISSPHHSIPLLLNVPTSQSQSQYLHPRPSSSTSNPPQPSANTLPVLPHDKTPKDLDNHPSGQPSNRSLYYLLPRMVASDDNRLLEWSAEMVSVGPCGPGPGHGQGRQCFIYLFACVRLDIPIDQSRSREPHGDLARWIFTTTG